MDLSKIIEQQKLLDKEIEIAHSIDTDNTDKMIIALYTEIGEFANEVQSFKYWKKQKTINQNNLLEEYADGLHFLMSFGIKLNCDSSIEPITVSQDINDQFLAMFDSVSKMSKKISKKKVQESIAIYLGLAKLLNISDEQINVAYTMKNKKNFERIKNNY